MKPLLVSVVCLLLCGAAIAQWPKPIELDAPAPLNFLCLGDWGVPEPRNVGSMASVVEQFNIDFTLAIGDNFYEYGVESVNDPQWNKTFEEVYHQDIFYKKWYVIQGNHDHRGNVQAQVDYTKHSSRWYMPALWYNEVMTIPGTSATVEFVFIDTVVLNGHWEDDDPQPQGPEDEELAEEHWTWIERTLSTSKANWLFVIGHYPVYSTGSHGPTLSLVQRLRPMLEKYKVAAYICGHDHGLQHLQYNGVHYFVTGNGAKSGLQNKHLPNVPSGSSQFRYPTSSTEQMRCLESTGNKCFGFGIAQLSEKTFTMRLFSSNWDHLLYESSIPNPRTSM